MLNEALEWLLLVLDIIVLILEVLVEWLLLDGDVECMLEEALELE